MFIPLSMLLLFGCSARINENRVAFDGFMFNSKLKVGLNKKDFEITVCLLYTSPSPRDAHESRMPSSA